MTSLLNVQLSQTPGATDYAFVNNHATDDIPAGRFVAVDASNLVGVGLHDGIGIKVIASTGDPTIGVTMETIKAGGGTGRVRCPGPIAALQSDGAITAGTYVEASAAADKVGFAKAAENNKSAGGIALNTSAADGDLVLVLLSSAAFTNA